MSGLATLTRTEEVWTISLARPEKRNALSGELVDELLDLVERAPREGARVLVFRGEGKNFSAGFDFSEVDRQSEGDLLLRFVRLELLLQAIAASPCLTVGLAHGRTFGAGVDLIAACRLRVAAPGSTFRMPGLKFGLVLGTRRFGDIVGREQAAKILETAATFDPAWARDSGFLHDVVEAEEWGKVLEDARTRASALPTWSRDALYQVLSSGRQADDRDLAWLTRSAARPGLKQRIAAYLQAA
jgi:enoyl-CoA hydratase/carnithine racemase